MKIGFNNFQSGQGQGFSVDMTFDEENCGCVPDSAGSGSVAWVDITGKPACIIDCATLLTFIQENAPGVKDSDEILAVADVDGVKQMFLVNRGITAGAYGSAAKTLNMSVNTKGIITAISEVDIAIQASSVSYTNVTYPSVNTVDDALDQLIALFGKEFYDHTQAVANTVWTINHNMAKKPSVTVLNAAGDLSFGRIAYTNDNQLSITFSEAIAGKAYCN